MPSSTSAREPKRSAPPRLLVPSLLLLILLLPSQGMAVDGFSVTTHWSGNNLTAYGGYGEIWRHDILDDTVIGHTLLYADPALPARNPVISPDGTLVAFLRTDGHIAVVSSLGGPISVLGDSLSHGEACLDWPDSEWIYYTAGGIAQPASACQLRRIHVSSHMDEAVVSFKKDDGSTPCAVWRFHIAHDLGRMIVRTDGQPPEPYNRITAYDLSEGDGRLLLSRSTDRLSCGTGLDPNGVLFIDGHSDHEGIDIRRFDDLETIKSIRWSDAQAFNPDRRDTGHYHNRNAWSANSSDWLCIHIGWGDAASRGANQMLINWRAERRIITTDNADGSFAFDDAGDFWVGTMPPSQPAFVVEPDNQYATEGESVSFFALASGSPPLELQWQKNQVGINGADKPQLTFVAQMADNDALYRCVASNAEGNVTSRQALLSVTPDQTAPEILLVEALGDPTRVSVFFSEAVATPGCEDTLHYSISPEIHVLSAQRQSDPSQVTLETSPLQPGISYAMEVHGVTDLADTPNALAPQTLVDFEFVECGDGLLAEYFDTVDLSGEPISRIEPEVWFDWGAGSPHPDIEADTFSARFSGEIRPPRTELVTFYARADDGVRLWVDKELIIDHFTIQAPTEHQASISLTAGERVEICMEVFEQAGGALAELQWSSPSQSKEIIPSSVMYSMVGNPDNRAPIVDAGLDAHVFEGDDLLLSGVATDDNSLWVRWSVLSGPGSAEFDDPDQPTTRCRFDAIGTYCLQLAADDGERRAYDQLLVHVDRKPSIHIVQPVGDDLLVAGSVVNIGWEAIAISDVRIDSSFDGGASWQLVAQSISRSSPYWGAFPWLVPDHTSDTVLIRLSDYFQTNFVESQPFAIRADGPSISVESPAAQDELEAGETVDIAWHAEGMQEAVLEYTLDGFSWEPIDVLQTDDPGWGHYPWSVPKAMTALAQIRIRCPDTGAMGHSGVFRITPSHSSTETLQVEALFLQGKVPAQAGEILEVRISEMPVVVKPDGSFLGEVDVPADAAVVVYRITGTDTQKLFEQVIRLNLDPIQSVANP